jgi:hypothetical protein
MIKRGEAFIDAYPKWRDMMNQLRGIAVSDNPSFMKKYKESLSYIVQPIIGDFKRAVEQGRLRGDINPEIMGFVFMGIGEYMSELYHLFNKYDKQEILDQVRQILLGLMENDQ